MGNTISSQVESLHGICCLTLMSRWQFIFIQTIWKKENYQLSNNISTLIPYRYWPELDNSELLDDHLTNFYQNLIGVLRWIIKLGHIDIHVNVAMMSQYMASPWSGHIEELFHKFAYLRKYNRSRIVFDGTMVDWKEKFKVKGWTDFYLDAIIENFYLIYLNPGG